MGTDPDDVALLDRTLIVLPVPKRQTRHSLVSCTLSPVSSQLVMHARRAEAQMKFDSGLSILSP